MGDEINITFETLYDLLRREKGKEELQQLEETFFKEVVQYLQEKNRLMESKTGDDDLFSVGEKDKLDVELRNIKRILKEFYDKREKKIIDMALNRSRTGSNIIDTSALLFEEKKLYEQLVEVFDDFRTSILFNIFRCQLPSPPIKKPLIQPDAVPEIPPSIPENAIKIKITSPVPKFINPIDGGFLGPFELGSEVMLQKPLAELLVEKKRAEFLP